MKVVGVISEYNPFHNGHKYQLDSIRERTNADYIVVAMSGDFIQRGEPALVDKYIRAQMALNNGADLVLEIPTLWATASAEYFASSGVNLLNSTGCVDTLCFGAEDDELDNFSRYAKLLLHSNKDMDGKINELLRKGISYPKARSLAFLETHSKDFDESFCEKISKPNNILAIEYLKAIIASNSIIKPMIIKRIGSGYNDTNIKNKYASASAIRKSLEDSSNIFTQLMPDSCSSLLLQCQQEGKIIYPNDLSQLLIYRLLCDEAFGFSQYADCNEAISSSIINKLNGFESYSQFADLIKTRNYTHTRITRALLHIMLQITHDDYETNKDCNFAPYLRVLGFKKASTPLLHSIKKEATVPLITKVADASSILNEISYKIFEKDLFASNLYNQLSSSGNSQIKVSNEYTHGPVIL